MSVYDYKTTTEIKKDFKENIELKFRLLGMLAYMGEHFARERDLDNVKSLIENISDDLMFFLRFSVIMKSVDDLVYKSGSWDVMGDMPYLIKHYISLYKKERGKDL